MDVLAKLFRRWEDLLEEQEEEEDARKQRQEAMAEDQSQERVHRPLPPLPLMAGNSGGGGGINPGHSGGMMPLGLPSMDLCDFPTCRRGVRLRRHWEDLSSQKYATLRNASSSHAALSRTFVEIYERVVPPTSRPTSLFPTSTNSASVGGPLRRTPNSVDEAEGHPPQMVVFFAESIACVASCACGSSMSPSDALTGCLVHGTTMLTWAGSMKDTSRVKSLCDSLEALGEAVRWQHTRIILFQMGRGLPNLIVSLLLWLCELCEEGRGSAPIPVLSILPVCARLIVHSCPSLNAWHCLANVAAGCGTGGGLRPVYTERQCSVLESLSERDDLIEELGMCANKDAWTALLVQAGAVEALLLALKQLVEIPAQTDELVAAECEIILGVGALIVSHPQSARDRLHICGGLEVLGQIIAQTSQESSSGGGNLQPPMLALLVAELCLRVGPPGPLPNLQGLDIVSAVATSVLSAAPRLLGTLTLAVYAQQDYDQREIFPAASLSVVHPDHSDHYRRSSAEALPEGYNLLCLDPSRSISPEDPHYQLKAVVHSLSSCPACQRRMKVEPPYPQYVVRGEGWWCPRLVLRCIWASLTSMVHVCGGGLPPQLVREGHRHRICRSPSTILSGKGYAPGALQSILKAVITMGGVAENFITPETQALHCSQLTGLLLCTVSEFGSEVTDVLIHYGPLLSYLSRAILSLEFQACGSPWKVAGKRLRLKLENVSAQAWAAAISGILSMLEKCAGPFPHSSSSAAMEDLDPASAIVIKWVSETASDAALLQASLWLHVRRASKLAPLAYDKIVQEVAAANLLRAAAPLSIDRVGDKAAGDAPDSELCRIARHALLILLLQFGPGGSSAVQKCARQAFTIVKDYPQSRILGLKLIGRALREHGKAGAGYAVPFALLRGYLSCALSADPDDSDLVCEVLQSLLILLPACKDELVSESCGTVPRLIELMNTWVDRPCGGVTVLIIGMSVLTSLISGKGRGKIALSSTLRSLADGSAPSAPATDRQSCLQREMTYEPLRKLLVRAPQSAASHVMHSLFELMLDGAPSDIGFLIGNAEALPLFFSTLPCWPMDLQIRALFEFDACLSGRWSCQNLAACCQVRPSCVDILIDLLLEQQERHQSLLATETASPDIGSSDFPEVTAAQTRLEDLQISILQKLGTHSFSVSQLRRLLRLMMPYTTSSTGVSVRSRLLTQLVVAMRHMMEDADGPPLFISFDGIHSGLEIPAMRRWPLARGYTFLCWVRVAPPDSETIHPCLLRLVDAEGRGVEIYLSQKAPEGTSHVIRCEDAAEPGSPAARQHSVELSSEDTMETSKGWLGISIVKLRGPSKSPRSTYVSRAVMAGQWCFVAVSQSPSGFGFGARGRVKILVRGRWMEEPKGYPRVPATFGPIPRVQIGCDGLVGEMGPVHLFGESFTEAQVRAFWQLGPDFCCSAEPIAVDQRAMRGLPRSSAISGMEVRQEGAGEWENILEEPQTQGLQSHHLACLGGASQSLVLAYFAGLRWEDGSSQCLFLDGARQMPPSSFPKAEMNTSAAAFCFEPLHARALPGTLAVQTCDVRDALHCIGGVEALLPLFAQVDLPLHSADYLRGLAPDALRVGNLIYSVDPPLVESMLALLSGALQNSTSCAKFLEKKRGLELVAHCLEQASPHHMSTQALMQICLLIERLGAWCEAWADLAISALLANFRLWTFASPDVQVQAVGVFRGLCRRCPGRMRRLVGVQSCLDSFILCFGYREELDALNSCAASFSFMSREWIHPVTRQTVGKRMVEGAAHGLVRERLLHAVLLMAGHEPGVRPNEVRSIMSVLLMCANTGGDGAYEILQLISRLMKEPALASRFVVAAGCASSEDGKDLLPAFASPSLIGSSSPQVRLLSLLILFNILAACLAMEETSKAEGAAAESHNAEENAANSDALMVSDPATKYPFFMDDGELDAVETALLNVTGIAPEGHDDFEPLAGDYLTDIDGSAKSGVTDDAETMLELHGSPWSHAGFIRQPGCTGLEDTLLLVQATIHGVISGPTEALAVAEALQALVVGLPAHLDAIHELFAGGSGEPGADVPSGAQVAPLHAPRLDSFFTEGMYPHGQGGLSAEPRLFQTCADAGSTSDFKVNRVKLPEALPALWLHLATMDAPSRDRLSHVFRMVSLLSCREIQGDSCDGHSFISNSDVVLSIPKWQQYLYTLVSGALARKCTDGISGADSLMEDQIAHVTLRLLAWLSMHSLAERGEVTILRETVSYLRIQSDELFGGMDVRQIGVDIFTSILKLLKREVDAVMGNTFSPWLIFRPSQDITPEQLQERRSYLQSGMWHVAALVIEFVILPPTFPAACCGPPPEVGFRTALDAPPPSLDVWQLVNLLVGVVGPMGDVLLSDATKSTWTSKRGHQTGFEQCSVLEDSKEDRSSEKRQRKKRHMDEDRLAGAGGVPWMLVHLLLGVFIAGGRGAGDGNDSEMQEKEMDAALVALQQLIALLNSLESGAYRHFSFEAMHTAAMVAHSLQLTRHPPSSPWVLGSLQLLIKCLDMVANEVEQLLCDSWDQCSSQLSTSSESKQPPGERLRFKRVEAGSFWGSIFGWGEAQKQKSQRATIVLHEIVGEISLSDIQTSDLTLEAIRRVLGIEKASSSPLTWEVWTQAMVPLLDEGAQLEESALLMRLDADGKHTHALRLFEGVLKLSRSRAEHKALATATAHVSVDPELLRLKCTLETWEKREGSCRGLWEAVLFRLAVERAPWGPGTYDLNLAQDTFWALAAWEDPLMRRLKMRRNLFGTKHESAALRSSQPHDLDASTGTINSSDHQPETRIASAETLWHDLCKYRFIGRMRWDSGAQSDAAEWGKRTMELEDEKEREGREEDLDMNAELLEGPQLLLFLTANAKTPIFTADCEIIQPYCITRGRIGVTRDRILFARKYDKETPISHDDEDWAVRPHRSSRWHLNDLVTIEPCHYRHQAIAVEMYFSCAPPVFLAFGNLEEVRTFCSTIRRLHPPSLRFWSRSLRTLALPGPSFAGSPQRVIPPTLSQSTIASTHAWDPDDATKAWQMRRISNFEYLMALNHAAGRGSRDLSQYPIFPWVVADWTSEELNLSDPATFRDLRWPMGAQTPENRKKARERFRDLEEAYKSTLASGLEPEYSMPPFHWGSHYSTAGFAIWYLMRMEPFTSLHILLQDGKFDRADRLLRGLGEAYSHCTSSSTDVKEAIPELYYLPEMLTNASKLNLGSTQDGKLVGDVELPPWAGGDPRRFVELHRSALESEYVSSNLHHWIDLVFGYKQRGRAAVEACNVFFHLTYSGAVDLPRLRKDDPTLYASFVKQIEEFGQTPPQLFTSPHPPRRLPEQVEVLWPLFSKVQGLPLIEDIKSVEARPGRILCFPRERVSRWPVVFLAEMLPWHDVLVTIDVDACVSNSSWQTLAPESNPPFRFRVEPSFPLPTPMAPAAALGVAAGQSAVVAAPVPLRPPRGSVLKPANFYVVHPPSGLLFSCGHWDCSFHVSALVAPGAPPALLQSIATHSDIVTCVALSGNYLVTGSRDCRVIVWLVDYSDSRCPVREAPLRLLCGHDSAISCIAASAALDLVISGSEDGSIMLHSICGGEYVRSIWRAAIGGEEACGRPRIDWVGLTDLSATIVTYSADDATLVSYSINGTPLASTQVSGSLPLHAFLFSEDGSVLLIGGDDCCITPLSTRTMETLGSVMDGACSVYKQGSFASPVTSMAFSRGERHLIVGLASGQVCVMVLDASYLRHRLQRKLHSLGLV